MNFKYLFTLVFTVLAMSLFAQKPMVVSSASMFTDMAKNIGGDLIETETIVPIGGDPHLHTPSPRDAKLVANADLLLLNGLTFEGWINELVENSGTEAKSILITEGIDPISSDTYKNSTDPHAWMDASNGLVYAKNICNALIELDPDNTHIYEENLARYAKQIKDLDNYIFERIKEIPQERRILITSHDAFKYYGKRYGIQLEAIQGISTDAEVQTADIKRVSYTISRYKVPAVFIESTINPKLLQQIAKDNDVEIGGSLYADSLGDEDSPASTYLDMLRYNTESIVNGLTGKSEMNDVELPEEGSKSSNLLLYLIIGFILIGGMIYLIKKLS